MSSVLTGPLVRLTASRSVRSGVAASRATRSAIFSVPFFGSESSAPSSLGLTSSKSAAVSLRGFGTGCTSEISPSPA
jgi:hypothetical protein